MEDLPSGQTQSSSSIGLWSDPKSEFSGTESPDRTHGSLKYAFWVLASSQQINLFCDHFNLTQPIYIIIKIQVDPHGKIP